MGSLCAPCRDDDVNKLKEITDIVPLLRSVKTWRVNPAILADVPPSSAGDEREGQVKALPE